MIKNGSQEYKYFYKERFEEYPQERNVEWVKGFLDPTSYKQNEKYYIDDLKLSFDDLLGIDAFGSKTLVLNDQQKDVITSIQSFLQFQQQVIYQYLLHKKIQEKKELDEIDGGLSVAEKNRERINTMKEFFIIDSENSINLLLMLERAIFHNGKGEFALEFGFDPRVLLSEHELSFLNNKYLGGSIDRIFIMGSIAQKYKRFRPFLINTPDCHNLWEDFKKQILHELGNIQLPSLNDILQYFTIIGKILEEKKKWENEVFDNSGDRDTYLGSYLSHKSLLDPSNLQLLIQLRSCTIDPGNIKKYFGNSLHYIHYGELKKLIERIDSHKIAIEKWESRWSKGVGIELLQSYIDTTNTTVTVKNISHDGLDEDMFKLYIKFCAKLFFNMENDSASGHIKPIDNLEVITQVEIFLHEPSLFDTGNVDFFNELLNHVSITFAGEISSPNFLNTYYFSLDFIHEDLSKDGLKFRDFTDRLVNNDNDLSILHSEFLPKQRDCITAYLKGTLSDDDFYKQIRLNFTMESAMREAGVEVKLSAVRKFPEQTELLRYIRLISKLMYMKNRSTKSRKRTEEELVGDQDEDQFFQSLYEKYNPEQVSFMQFLKQGGEFLKPMKSECDSHKNGYSCKLSRLYASHSYVGKELQGCKDISQLSQIIAHTEQQVTSYERFQESTKLNILGQDQSMMLFLREGVQNARDAMKRHNITGSIRVDFGMIDNAWMTKISDPVGMDLDTILNNLLIPGKGEKVDDDKSSGMFGIGFYTFLAGAKKLSIKTKKGDGSCYIIQVTPCREKGHINDLDITISELQDDEFQGTVVERVDEREGISSNLQAMLGLGQLHKYVGMVDDVDISYNGERINKPGNKTILSEVSVPVYKNHHVYGDGTATDSSLKLVKMKDGIIRMGLRGLYMNQIPQELLSSLPDRIQEKLKKDKVCLELPERILPNRSRTAMAYQPDMIDYLKSYFVSSVMQYVLDQVAYEGYNPPLLPHDYFFNHDYEYRMLGSGFAREGFMNYVEQCNNGEMGLVIDTERRKKLCNKESREFFMGFLLRLGFTNRKGEKTSLLQIKQNKEKEYHERVRSQINESIRRETLITPKVDLNVRDLDSVANYLTKDRKDLDVFMDYRRNYTYRTLPQYMNEYDINLGFCYSNDGGGARAGKECMIFNLYDHEDYLKYIIDRFRLYNNALDKYKDNLKAMLEMQFINLGAGDFPMFIETIIHESVHIEEAEDGISVMTHNDTDMESDYSFISRYRRGATRLARSVLKISMFS